MPPWYCPAKIGNCASGFFSLKTTVSLLGVKTVVPMHFATFPILAGNPSQLQELVGPQVTVLDIKPGSTV